MSGLSRVILALESLPYETVVFVPEDALLPFAVKSDNGVKRLIYLRWMRGKLWDSGRVIRIRYAFDRIACCLDGVGYEHPHVDLVL